MARVVKNPRTCPHCGKEVRRAVKPRDLGLLLHALCYRVPVHVEEITPKIIEVARKHCKMESDRLKELQGPDYARFWDYMLDRRERRRNFMQETGEVPAYGWTPPEPGEPDRGKAVLAMHLHRMCAAKVKKHLKDKPEKYEDRISWAFERCQKMKNTDSRLKALNEVLQMIHLKTKAAAGKEMNTDEMLELDALLGTGLKKNRRARREGPMGKRDSG